MKNKNDELVEYCIRLNNVMSRAWSAYCLWKQLKVSISPKDIGHDEASRRLGIMNSYHNGHLFSTIMYALEQSFILDLQKFFENQRISLRLISSQNKSIFDDSFLLAEDMSEIKVLLNADQITKSIDNLKILRDNFVAHEAKELPENTKIHCLEMEDLFIVIQKILGIVAKRSTKEFIVWDMAEQDTQQSFKTFLDDLSRGAIEREKQYEN